MISFDNDRFKGIPMHLNPLFSPLKHDNSFPDQEVVDDDFVMLGDYILDIKNSNHYSNVIDTHVSNVNPKGHLVGR
jgi:hypothetical protein